MHYFTPDQVPVLARLAKQFAVCDHWFASAPCQTWPNRWFVHAATADGHENNNPPYFPDVPTIFNRLEEAGIDSWKIYFHDIAQAHTLLQLFLLGQPLPVLQAVPGRLPGWKVAGLFLHRTTIFC